MENQEKVLRALIEKPSKYTIEVSDNSMLPEADKEKKELTFTIKPPTLEVLSKCAVPLLKVPENIRNSSNLKLEDVIPFIKEMTECISVLAHGQSDDYPAWYPEFFSKNLTGKEVYMLFYESSLKTQTDFFLSSFQSAGALNPMMMTSSTKTMMEDSTRTVS